MIESKAEKWRVTIWSRNALEFVTDNNPSYKCDPLFYGTGSMWPKMQIICS